MRGRVTGRRDANEKLIVAQLRNLGCDVYFVAGRGNPDLLVRTVGGRWVPLEVKTPNGKLTPNQQALQWPVVRSVEDAVQAVFG